MSFRQTFLVVLSTLLFVGAAERVYHTYSWAGDVNRRSDAGVASFRFLGAPAALDPATGKPLKSPDGVVITNADVLAVLVKERLARRGDAPAGPRPADR
jgi:hypothetical protein